MDMGRPLRIEYPDAYYHVTARGNERKDIFKNDLDREKFFSYLDTAFMRYGAVIHAYCLMNNHYHLLIETPDGNLSQIMRHINGAYTNYYNAKRKRAGHLFQGRYKAILINADEYAGELSRYIHLNPVRAGMVSNPEEYRWSSYMAYIGKEKKPKWLRTEFILNYFGRETREAQQKYKDFVNSMIDKEHKSPLKEAVASTILGGADFVEEIKRRYLEGKEADRNLPALTELRKVSLREIMKEADTVFGGGTVLSRKAALYLSHRHSGRTLKEIGTYFKIGESAVSQSSRRFSFMLTENRRLKRKIRILCDKLSLCNV